MGVCGSNEQESHIDEIFASRAEAATVATQCKEVEVIFNRLNEVMWNEFDPANKGRDRALFQTICCCCEDSSS